MPGIKLRQAMVGGYCCKGLGTAALRYCIPWPGMRYLNAAVPSTFAAVAPNSSKCCSGVQAIHPLALSCIWPAAADRTSATAEGYDQARHIPASQPVTQHHPPRSCNNTVAFEEGFACLISKQQPLAGCMAQQARVSFFDTVNNADLLSSAARLCCYCC